jgi:hypothetical protein
MRRRIGMYRFILSVMFAITGVVTYSLELLVYSKYYNMIVNKCLKISKNIILHIGDKTTYFIFNEVQYEVVNFYDGKLYSIIITAEKVFFIRKIVPKLIIYDSVADLPIKFRRRLL